MALPRSFDFLALSLLTLASTACTKTEGATADAGAKVDASLDANRAPSRNSGHDAGGPGSDGALSSSCGEPYAGLCSDTHAYYRYDDKVAHCVPFEWIGCEDRLSPGVFRKLTDCSNTCTQGKAFLDRCRSSRDCGFAMDCVESACTPSCKSNDDCKTLAHGADCGPDGHCGVSCTGRDDCDAQYDLRCVDERCGHVDCEVTRAEDVCPAAPKECTAPKVSCRYMSEDGCNSFPECGACVVDGQPPASETPCDGNEGLDCDFGGRFGDLDSCACLAQDAGPPQWKCLILLSP